MAKFISKKKQSIGGMNNLFLDKRYGKAWLVVSHVETKS